MTLDRAGDHAPDGARAPPAPSRVHGRCRCPPAAPARLGPRPARPLRPRAADRARRAPRDGPAARQGASARTSPRRAGPRSSAAPSRAATACAARGAPVRRGPGRVRAPHGHTNDYAPEESAGIVLGIARYHRDSNGWNDIGYNFLVDKYGQVFEGRAGGIDQAVVGAQAQGYNSVSTGIACTGPSPPCRGGGRVRRARAPDRLEALAPRRADRGHRRRDLGGGASNRYPAGRR